MKRCLLILIFLTMPVAAGVTSEPVREFLDNPRQIFSTEGHPKSKGASVTIEYPANWKAKEGRRPNVVQLFTSNDGKGLETATIVTKSLPLEPGEEVSIQEMREVMQPGFLSNSLPDGAMYLDGQATEIEGIPAVIIEFEMVGERAGMRIPIRSWMIGFIDGATLVQIQFQVVARDTEQLEDKMNMFRPLFQQMANTIILLNRWK